MINTSLPLSSPAIREDYDDHARWLDDQDGGNRWENWAACRDHDPAMFFPVDVKLVAPATRDQDGNVVTEAVYVEEESPYPTPEVKAICDRCPVRWRCLERNMNEEFGVYGGMTGFQRALMNKKITRKKCVNCPSTDVVLNNNQKKELCLACGTSWDVL